MKILILGLVLLLQQKGDSTSVWRNVGAAQRITPQDGDRPLSDAQIEAIKEALALKTDKRVLECRDFESADSVLQKLRFERLQLSSNRETALVEAGPGCLRGGQGSNGAMWVVQLNPGGATVLASPAEEFEGYLYSVQPTTSKGYRDIVVGWHLGASEVGLAYFRFDGTQYRKLSQATARFDDDGKETIVPAK